MPKISQSVPYSHTSLTLRRSGRPMCPPQHVIPQKRHLHNGVYLKNNWEGVVCSWLCDLLSGRLERTWCVISIICQNYQLTSNSITVKSYMCSAVNMNRIWWHIKARKWVVEHIIMGFEEVPIWLGDTILSFPAVDSSKVKRAIDECIVMCQINPFTKWK